MYRRFTIFNTSDNIEIIHTCGIDYPTCEHTHSKWIIGIVVSGRRSIEIEKKMYEVHEGAYYIVPPNSPHRLISGTIENETIVVCLPGNGKDSTDSSLNTRYNFYSREHGIRKFKKEYGLPPGRMAR